MQRSRQTVSKCKKTGEILKTGFVNFMQIMYNIQFPGIREALVYYRNLSSLDKRRFTNSWKELDRLIGKEPKGSKTYSYKFINEVVAGQFINNWQNETKEKARNFAQSIIYQRMEQFLDQKTDAEMCKDVIDLTFQEFNNFQDEEVVGTAKVLQDMLRHFTNSKIPKIRTQQKNKAKQILHSPKQNNENIPHNLDLFPDSKLEKFPKNKAPELFDFSFLFE
ncbi:Hypothetical_protein [Hexamita inflata]|uniref:Hypothetical_protein n=1 Tax=Hexamita inflata TaxID=28002 RepID=A0AA86USM2_9EUKA|nr:Hypothetical protein HINF_LOCUS54014 [Hexamita inflata]